MDKTEVLETIKWLRANKDREIKRPQDEILAKQISNIQRMRIKQVKIPKKISLSKFDNYSVLVRRLSKSLPIYSESSRDFVLDHKISIKTCFHKNISIEDAAHESNLRIIPYTWNSKKMSRNYIDDRNIWILDKYDIKQSEIVCVTEEGDLLFNKSLIQT